MSGPTDTDFDRLEEKVQTTAEKHFARLEQKIDVIAGAVAQLMVLEERQDQTHQRFEHLRASVAGIAERFDARTLKLEERVQELQTELAGHKQRVLGVAGAVSAVCVVLGAAWSVASKFIP